MTCGARREAYRGTGAYANELRGLFSPFEQTARLCGMRFLPPYAVFAAGHAIEEGRLEAHANEFARLLQAIADDALDLDAAAAAPCLSDDVEQWIGGAA